MVLRRIDNIKKLLLIIRKRQLKLLGHIIRKKSLENLTLKGQVKEIVNDLLDESEMDGRTRITK